MVLSRTDNGRIKADFLVSAESKNKNTKASKRNCFERQSEEKEHGDYIAEVYWADVLGRKPHFCGHKEHNFGKRYLRKFSASRCPASVAPTEPKETCLLPNFCLLINLSWKTGSKPEPPTWKTYFEGMMTLIIALFQNKA